MNWGLLVPLLVTSIVAVIGWLVAHRLAAARDRANRRRDLRVQYLIEAYRRLERVGNRTLDMSTAPDIESAIADVQLFGSREQVEFAKRFAEHFAETRSVSYSRLLEDLRSDLRKELRLEAVPAGLRHLRITLKSDEPS